MVLLWWVSKLWGSMGGDGEMGVGKARWIRSSWRQNFNLSWFPWCSRCLFVYLIPPKSLAEFQPSFSATFLPEVPWSAPRTHCHLVMRSSKEHWGSSLFRLLGFRSPLPDSAGEFVLFAGFRVVRLKVFVLRTLSILETSSKILGRHSRDKVCGNGPPPFHVRSLTTHCVSIWGQNASAGHGWRGGRYLAGATALFEINDSGGGRGSVASLICDGVYGCFQK